MMGRKSIPTDELTAWATRGYRCVMPDFDRPGYWVVEPTMSRADLEGLHAVLRRALERHERRGRQDNGPPDPLAVRLAEEVAAVAEELGRES